MTSPNTSRTIPTTLVDAAAVQEVCSLMPGRVQQLLQIFQEDAAAYVAAISAAVQQTNPGEAGRVAHTLKSSARQLGAVALGSVAADVEQTARSANPDLSALNQMAAHLATLLPATCAALHQAVTTNAPSKGGSLTLGIIALSLLWGTSALAAPRTLNETLQLAVSHPALAAQAAQVQAGTAAVRRARGAYRPTISGDVQSGVQRYDEGSIDDGAVGRQRLSGTDALALARLSMLQPLLDGSARRADVAAATARLAGSKENQAWQQRQQHYAAAAAHIRLWLAQELVTANGQSLQALNDIAAAVQRRRSLGDATVTEVAEAASRAAGAAAAQTELDVALASARAQYLDAVGAQAPEDDTVDAPVLPAWPQHFSAPGRSATAAANQFAAGQVVQHPLVVAARYRVDAAEAAVTRERAQYYPALDLAGNVQHDAFGGLSRDEGTNTGTVTLNLHYDFYQGGRAVAGVREATALRKAAEADQRAALLAVSSEAQAALRRWQGAATRLQQQATALAEARRVLVNLGTETRQGNRTLRDLLDARRDEIGALSLWLNAAADQALAGYDLQRWLGTAETMQTLSTVALATPASGTAVLSSGQTVSATLLPGVMAVGASTPSSTAVITPTLVVSQAESGKR